MGRAVPPWLGWRPLGTLQEPKHKPDLIQPCHTDSHVHRETRQTENCPFWAKSPAQKRNHFKHWTSSHVLLSAPLLFLSDVACLLSPLSAAVHPSPPVCPEPLASYLLLLQLGPHNATPLPFCSMGQILTLLEGFPLPVGKPQTLCPAPQHHFSSVIPWPQHMHPMPEPRALGRV